jgi:hypothetical protein
VTTPIPPTIVAHEKIHIPTEDEAFTSAYARLCRVATKPPEERSDWMKTYNLSDYYEIDPRFNEMRNFVARPKQTSAPTVVVFRATSTKNIRDLATDAELVNGNFMRTTHLKDADTFLTNVMGTYDPYNVQLTGYSLGGATAHELALRHDLPSKVFNPAAVLPKDTSLVESLWGLYAPESVAAQNSNPLSRQEIYVSALDGISRNAIYSYSTKLGRPKIHYQTPKRTGFDPHDVEQFF